MLLVNCTVETEKSTSQAHFESEQQQWEPWHEQTVARATPVEFTSKLPPRVNRWFEGLAWEQLRDYSRHLPGEPYQTNYRGKSCTIITIFDQKNWMEKEMWASWVGGETKLIQLSGIVSSSSMVYRGISQARTVFRHCSCLRTFPITHVRYTILFSWRFACYKFARNNCLLLARTWQNWKDTF